MIDADLTSHHISGIAREGNVPFRVALLSQINENLWMGGCPKPIAPAGISEFRFVVNLYPWEPYPIEPEQTALVSALYDAGELPDLEQLEFLADYVRRACALGPTLVHCQAGLNRSGLVCALALVRGGMLPAEAIALLREKRCAAVLCNQAFERFLLGLAV